MRPSVEHELAAVFQGGHGGVFQPAAAGHLHAQHRHAPDVVAAEDLGQLFAVVHSIQLGAADEGDLALHELFVHIGVGVGGAVGCDQELCPVKIGGVHRHQLDLAGPLAQLRRLCGGGGSRCAFLPAELAHGAARAAVEGRFCSLCRLFLLVFQHGLLVVGGCLALFKGDGTGGAAGQAVAKAVAVVVPHELCLTVHQTDGTLVAGGDTGPAAVAFFFVYMNDFPDHRKASLCLCFEYTIIRADLRLL